MDNSVKTSRDIGIDLLKSIAILGVIIIHVCSEGYSNPIASFNWISTVFLGSLVRGSVPIFLMCSGALLLDPSKEMTIKRLYFRNILRIVLAMFAWSMMYKVFHLIISGTFGISGLIQSLKEVFLLNQEFHMYYIHIMIIAYVFLPITRVFIKNATQKELVYALSVWFILGIVYPTVKIYWPFNLLSGIPVQWLINMTYASIGYGILGFYITRYPLSTKCNCLLSVTGFIFVFGLTTYMSVKNGILYERFLEGMSVGVALLATGIFGLFYNMKEKMSCKAAILCTKLSKGSFCIFLVHVFVIYLFGHFGIGVNDFPCFVSIPLLSALNLFLSYVIYFVISKIPFVNRWLI